MWQKIGIFAVFIIMFALVAWSAYQDNQAWEQYSKSHHCVARGAKKGHITTSFDSKGNAVYGTTPDQIIYTCDGEEIQIR